MKLSHFSWQGTSGDGTFTRSSSFDAKGWTYSVAACDLDGDSDNDLTSNLGWIWLNNGDGTFQPPFSKGYSPNYPSAHSSDLDGDGDEEMAVVSVHSRYVLVMFNTTIP